MSDSIRVLVVDDHPLFREGVVHTLRDAKDIRVIGEAEDADQAVRLAREHLPDVVLLDLNIPGGGLAAARGIAEACPVAKIIALTVSENEDDLVDALKAGARAYVLKGVAGKELVGVVHAVQAGEVYVAPSLAARLLVEMTRAPRVASPLEELTEREKQILELVAEGATNREVGQRLHLSEKTVKHYMTNILQKLHVRSRVEAALFAHRAGLGDSR